MAERVFFVVQAGARADGGVTSVTELMTRLAAPVRVVTNAETAITDTWRRAGLGVDVCPALYWSRPSASGRTSLELIRAVSAVARALPRDTAHIYSNDIWSALAVLPIAFTRRQRLTLFVRDTKPPGERYGVHWRIALRAAHRTIALSEEMCWHLCARAGASRRRLSHIYSIVDLHRFRPLPEAERCALRGRQRIPSAAPVIVVPAAAVAKKQQAEFIEECARSIAGAHPDVHIVFAGDFEPERSAYVATVQRAAAASGLGSTLHFVGFVEPMQEVYALADVVVLPSRNEGLARGMIEALACGVPFVGFNVCSAREIVERHDVGRVVPLGDWSALAAAVTQLLARADVRREYGQRARAVAERLFGAERAIEQLLALERAA